jgi:hypothetical protein
MLGARDANPRVNTLIVEPITNNRLRPKTSDTQATVNITETAVRKNAVETQSTVDRSVDRSLTRAG